MRPDPNFKNMTIEQLEKFIQEGGAIVDKYREQNRRAHAVLLEKIQVKEQQERANRPPDFPTPQILGQGRPQ